MLDTGRDACPACEAIVDAGVFCNACGERLIEAPPVPEVDAVKTCGACKRETRGIWCSHCGGRVVSETVERVRRGETDWHREAAAAQALYERLVADGTYAAKRRDPNDFGTGDGGAAHSQARMRDLIAAGALDR